MHSVGDEPEPALRQLQEDGDVEQRPDPALRRGRPRWTRGALQRGDRATGAVGQRLRCAKSRVPHHAPAGHDRLGPDPAAVRNPAQIEHEPLQRGLQRIAEPASVTKWAEAAGLRRRIALSRAKVTQEAGQGGRQEREARCIGPDAGEQQLRRRRRGQPGGHKHQATPPRAGERGPGPGHGRQSEDCGPRDPRWRLERGDRAVKRSTVQDAQPVEKPKRALGGEEHGEACL